MARKRTMGTAVRQQLVPGRVPMPRKPYAGKALRRLAASDHGLTQQATHVHRPLAESYEPAADPRILPHGGYALAQASRHGTGAKVMPMPPLAICRMIAGHRVAVQLLPPVYDNTGGHWEQAHAEHRVRTINHGYCDAPPVAVPARPATVSYVVAPTLAAPLPAKFAAMVAARKAARAAKR